MRPCLALGCPRLVKSGRCRDHASRHKQRRAASPPRQVYTNTLWRRARADAIERAGGRCQAIELGARCTETSRLHGHHDYEGGVEQLLADGHDPFDGRWIVVLCDSHHGRVEAWLRRNRGLRR